MSGRFITFEGIEGAGKSTALRAVAAALSARGLRVRTTFEPGDTPLGAELRRLVLHDADPVDRAELFLYLADRAEHVERVIAPALAAGEWVLCDRFTDSTVAYQAFGRGLDFAEVAAACRFAAGIEPHATLLLDVAVDEGLARAAVARGQLDRLESADREFHERVRAGFLTLAEREPRRIRVLDAGRTASEVAAAAVAAIEDLA